MEESAEDSTFPPLSTILVAVLWILDNFALVPVVGTFISLFIVVFIPLRLYGQPQIIKRKVNILLIIVCWINVMASMFQALADLSNDQESYEMTRQVSIASSETKIYLWLQNISILFLFISRKMTTVVAIYWKTYSTSLAPENVSNWKWWMLHLALNIPYCIIQGYLYLIPVFDFLLRSDITPILEIIAMILGITCQLAAMLTIFYCLVKIGRKMRADDVSDNVREHYWRLAIGLALKTIALLIPIVESVCQTKNLIFTPTQQYFRKIESGDGWAIAQTVVHLFRSVYPTMDSLITLGMLWHLMYPRSSNILIQIEPATDSLQARNR